MSTVIQSNLKAVGVNVALQTMEWGAYLAKLRTKEQDLFALSWMAGNEDPDMVMYPLLHSSQWTPNGPNRALYKNDKYDELLHQARLTTDQKKRAELYREAQRILVDDAPVGVRRSRESRRPRTPGALQGFKLHRASTFGGDHLAQVSLPTGERTPMKRKIALLTSLLC